MIEQQPTQETEQNPEVSKESVQAFIAKYLSDREFQNEFETPGDVDMGAPSPSDWEALRGGVMDIGQCARGKVGRRR